MEGCGQWLPPDTRLGQALKRRPTPRPGPHGSRASGSVDASPHRPPRKAEPDPASATLAGLLATALRDLIVERVRDAFLSLRVADVPGAGSNSAPWYVKCSAISCARISSRSSGRSSAHENTRAIRIPISSDSRTARSQTVSSRLCVAAVTPRRRARPRACRCIAACRQAGELVAVSDYLELLERSTYGGDRVR